MKIWKMFFGLLCILIATMGLLDAIGVIAPMESIFGALSWIQIACGLFILALIINDVFKFKIVEAVFFLSILFMIFEKNIAFMCDLPSANIINNWLLLLLTTLFCIGLSFILPKKKNKHRKEATVNFSLGSNSIYIDCSDFNEERYIKNDMGSTTVKFENTEAYTGGGTIDIHNHMGSVTVTIPKEWSVICDMDNSLGSIDCDYTSFSSAGPSIKITGENHLGSVDISPEE